jgi:hypothetical protein
MGEMQTDTIALALLKAHVDASDEELKEWNVSRGDLLWLARDYMGDGYNAGRLATIGEQVIKAFVAGRHSPEKR